MTIVYKICAADDWAEAVRQGTYRGSPDDLRYGFIHLSAKHQLQGTLDRHFAGRAGLVLIAFDEASLAGLRWEALRNGALFPHVYGVLPADSALWVRDLPNAFSAELSA